MVNALYYGDNFDVLRESIASESVDLIYLNPPFNSQATYNVLFRSPAGVGSQAQIEAFEDTQKRNPGRSKGQLYTCRSVDAVRWRKPKRNVARATNADGGQKAHRRHESAPTPKVSSVGG